MESLSGHGGSRSCSRSAATICVVEMLGDHELPGYVGNFNGSDQEYMLRHLDPRTDAVTGVGLPACGVGVMSTVASVEEPAFGMATEP